MHRLRISLALALALPACAQTPHTVNIITSSACVAADGTTAPMASGSLTVQATDAKGNALAFGVTGGGLATLGTVTRAITNGLLQGTLALANPAVTNPLNIGYVFRVTNTTTHVVTPFPPTLISPDASGNYDLCNLMAGTSTPPNPLQQALTLTTNVAATPTFIGGVLNIPPGTSGGVVTPSIAAGNTTTLSPGQPATLGVRASGSSYLIDAGIPQGQAGAAGQSAYQLWLANGNTGTLAQYLASLQGAAGSPGTPGANGVGVNQDAAHNMAMVGANATSGDSPYDCGTHPLLLTWTNNKLVTCIGGTLTPLPMPADVAAAQSAAVAASDPAGAAATAAAAAQTAAQAASFPRTGGMVNGPVSGTQVGAESMADPSTATGSPSTGPNIGATLSACEAAAEVNLGDWCDTRRLGDNTHAYTVDTAQFVGGGGSGQSLNKAHWELPVRGFWTVNIPGATNTTDAFTIKDGSTWHAATAPGLGGQMKIVGTAGETLRSLFSSDSYPASASSPYQSYVGVDGLYLDNNGATVGASFYWHDLYDGADAKHVLSGNSTGMAALFDSICCHAVASDISLNSRETSTGGLPLGIHGVTEMTFDGMTTNAPGLSYPNFSTNPTAPPGVTLSTVNGTSNGNLVFIDEYSERVAPYCTGTNVPSGCNPNAVFDNSGSWVTGTAPKMIGGNGTVADTTTPGFSNPWQSFLVNLGWLHGNNYIGELATDNFGFHSANSRLFGQALQQGQVGVGSVTFTPSATGYVRIYSGLTLNGYMDIAGAGNQDLVVFVHGGHYGSTPTLTMINTGSDLGANTQIVTEVAASTDGGVNEYVDLNVAIAHIPITVNFFGQVVDKGSIIQAPAASSGPVVANPYALLDISQINTEMGDGVMPSVYTTGFGKFAGVTTQAMTSLGSGDNDFIGNPTIGSDGTVSRTFTNKVQVTHPICEAHDITNGTYGVPTYSGGNFNWVVSWAFGASNAGHEMNYMCGERVR